MLDPVLLRTFLAVVDEGGFHAAADSMFTSQSMISKHVRRLESVLDVRLLDRGPWGTRLTPYGQTFAVAARRALRELEALTSSTVALGQETVRMGAAATAAGTFLAPFLSHWIPQHPELRISMIEDGSAALRQRLERHECDIALLADPIPPHLEHRYITTVVVQALIPEGHPLERSDGPLNIRALHGERCLINSSPFLSSELFNAACRLARCQPDVVYTSAVGQTLAALAEAGVGIAVLGDSVDLRAFDLARRPLTDADGRQLSFDLHMSWAREMTLSPRIERMIEELSSFAALPSDQRRSATASVWHRS